LSEGILVGDHDHGIQGIYIAVAIEVGYREASIGDAVPSNDEVVVGGVDPAGIYMGPARNKGVMEVCAVARPGGRPQGTPRPRHDSIVLPGDSLTPRTGKLTSGV